jgi:tight adherence protein B
VTRKRLKFVMAARDAADASRVGWARAGAGLVAAGSLVLAVAGLRTTVVVGGLLAIATMRIWRARRVRQTTETHASIVELCRAIAAELRAGHPSGHAFAAAVHAAPPALVRLLQPSATIARRGDIGDLADEVARVAATPGCAGLRRLAACWRVAAASGAALAPAIDRVADALQDEIDVSRDVTSTLAGPRATVHLLAGLPVLGLLLGTAIGARPVHFLLGSGPGVGCLLAAALLDATGVAWARRIAHRAVRFG